jgi:hypothetical protein
LLDRPAFVQRLILSIALSPPKALAPGRLKPWRRPVGGSAG